MSYRHKYNRFNSRSYVAEIVIFSVLKRFVLCTQRLCSAVVVVVLGTCVRVMYNYMPVCEY